MKNVLFGLILISLPALTLSGQVSSFNKQDSVAIRQKLEQHVYTLAADSMSGRPAGTVYEAKAGRYLVNEIRKCIPAEYEFHIREFSFVVNDTTWNTATNICVRPDSISKTLLLLTAHYDHLPPGSPYSKSIRKRDECHPGADDNASGVAMAMELFRALISDSSYAGPEPVLLLTSGHEQGMHGTKEWLESSRCVDSISMALNFDMIGRMDDDVRILNILMPRNDLNLQSFVQKLKSNSTTYKIKLISRYEKFYQTDAGLLFKKGIPAMSVNTGMHHDYHRPSDTPDKINLNKMINIFAFLHSGLCDFYK